MISFDILEITCYTDSVVRKTFAGKYPIRIKITEFSTRGTGLLAVFGLFVVLDA